MLSNTATPQYYEAFRRRVLSGEIPVCHEIEMEMNRIDRLVDDCRYYYDDQAIDGFIRFCEREMTLTDGEQLHLLDTFKLWAEQVLGWWYFEDRSVYVPGERGESGHFERKRVRRRLVNKQYLIVGRGAAKSLYMTLFQAYFLTIDTSTTHQITTAPTMKLAEEVMSPFATAISRHPGPLFSFLTQGSLQNTSPTAKANRPQLSPTKKGIENFLTNSVLEIRPMTINKLQSLRTKINTVDEWLSGDIREDVIGAIEQGASKVDDYLILAVSSEGLVRNGAGDNIKLELLKILRGEYQDPHTSIFYYRLDDVKEVGDPSTWRKAQPNLGYTVSYETYQRDVERAENVPHARNDILAKRFPWRGTRTTSHMRRRSRTASAISGRWVAPWVWTSHRATTSARSRSCSPWAINSTVSRHGAISRSAPCFVCLARLGRSTRSFWGRPLFGCSMEACSISWPFSTTSRSTSRSTPTMCAA